MTLYDYLRRILARWRTIALVAAVVVAGVVFATLRADAVYTSYAQLYVNNVSDEEDVEAVLAKDVHAQERVASYAAVARSAAMAERVKEDLDLPYPVDGIAGLISTDVPFSTVVIDLRTQGSTPEEAQAIGESVVEHYNELLAELEDTEGTGLDIQVSTLHEPTLPEGPSSPNMPFNLLAGVTAGLLLGLAAAALRDLLDRTVKGPEELESAGLVVLARVPDGDAADSDESAESLRQLRAVLEGGKRRAVVVAAPGPDQGATHVAAGLAATYARAGRKVVLVDADLRAPEAGQRVGTADGPGLVGVLTGQATLDDALRWNGEGLGTTPDGLAVLPAGGTPADAGELVASRGVHALVRELRERFDVVVVDAPPVGPYADAGVLARHVDGLVLVVSRDRTTTPELKAAVDGLAAMRATTLGGVLNRTRA